jgi:hypothetical protein
MTGRMANISGGRVPTTVDWNEGVAMVLMTELRKRR